MVRLMAAPKSGRKLRNPQHRFQIRNKPWQVQPFLIAPVLAGETLKNLLFQARGISDRLNATLLGWHVEYYFFYCKLRDLDDRATLTQMLLDTSTSTAALNEASRTFTYHRGSRIDYTHKCLKRIVEEYFRNEGEDWLTGSQVDNVPLASVIDHIWWENATNEADWDAYETDLASAGSMGGTQVLTSEIDLAMRNYRYMQTMGVMTNMSFEDYLRQFGVRSTAEESHKPELIRYVREWQYPTNTVEPTTGVPSTALSWSVAERADKDRYFTEPGFVVGVFCGRPKVYFKGQTGSATALLDTAFSWMPTIMSDDPRTSVIGVASPTNSPLSGVTDAAGYYVDIKDLFLHGDQFINFANTATDAGLIDLPTAALLKRYASSTDINSLFVDSAGGKNLLRQDGVVSMNIATHLVETSPVMSDTAGLFG